MKKRIRATTREKLRQAAEMRADGIPVVDIAKRLKITPRALQEIVKRHPKLWQRDYLRAVDSLVDKTPEPDCDALRKAVDEGQFTARINLDGKPPENPGELSLMAFLHTVYVPMRGDLDGETVHQMEVTIGKFDKWLGRPVLLSDLTDTNVLQFLASYRSKVSPTTCNSKRCQLLAMWRLAHEERYVESLWRKIPRMREYRRAPEAWTVDEVGRVFAAANGEKGNIDGIDARLWWKSLLMAIYDSGERRGAMLAARSEHLFTDRSMLFLPAEQRKDRADRWHALHPDTLQVIMAIHNPERELIWPWPWSREWFDQRLKRLLDRAGVRYGRGKGGSLHKMRRTSGTLVEAAGGDGSRHLGNGRAIFERHYLDPREARQHHLTFLPRPRAAVALLEGPSES